MTANNISKIHIAPRIPLQTVIPLETPFSVAIEITNLCNVKCKFCYHYDTDSIKQSGISFGFMDFELFCKIIDDLCKFPQRLRKLKIGGFGEPLLNKSLPKMISYAKHKKVANYIELYTNGVALNNSLNMQLIEAGLDWINISVNGIDNDDFYKTCGRKIDMDEYIEKIEHLYLNKNNCKLYIKLGDVGYTEQQKNLFLNKFEKVCDEIFIEKIVDNVWTDANLECTNSTIGVFGQNLDYKHVCPHIFTTFLVLHTGKAVACCADWKGEYIIGDFDYESAVDFWKGDKIRNLQIIHLKKKRAQFNMCKICNQPMAFTIDDIDNYCEEILLKYK